MHHLPLFFHVALVLVGCDAGGLLVAEHNCGAGGAGGGATITSSSNSSNSAASSSSDGVGGQGGNCGATDAGPEQADANKQDACIGCDGGS